MASLSCTVANAHGKNSIWSCNWSQLGYLATGGLDGVLKLWRFGKSEDDSTRDVLEPVFQESENLEDRKHRLGIVSVNSNSSGDVLASSSLDNQIRVFSVTDSYGLDIRRIIQTDTFGSWTVCVNPIGTQLATGTKSGKARIFSTMPVEDDSDQDNAISELDATSDFVSSIGITPDGKYLGTGSSEGEVSLFDLNQGEIVAKVQPHGKTIRQIAFSPDSSLVVTASYDNTCKLLDMRLQGSNSRLKASVVDTFIFHKAWAVDVAFGDGDILATSSCDGTICVWDMKKRTSPLSVLKSHTDSVWGLDFAPTEVVSREARGDSLERTNILASVSEDTSIRTHRLTFE